MPQDEARVPLSREIIATPPSWLRDTETSASDRLQSRDHAQRCPMFRTMSSFSFSRPRSFANGRRPALRQSIRNLIVRRSHGESTLANAAFHAAALLLCFITLLPTQPARADSSPPDLLFIAVDDLNDWISLLDPASPIRTPNLERLASRGMLFTRAYCVSPACNPSRAATLVGQRPSTTGVYGNKSDWRRAVGNRPTILKRLRDAGYQVHGAGKIFHHHLNNAFHDEQSFESFVPMRPQLYPPQKLNEAPEYGSRNTDWGIWPESEADSIDARTVDHCIEQLERTDLPAPRAIACGIFKPHSPFFAPEQYHQPFVNLQPPERSNTDWNDLPSGAHQLLDKKKWFWNGMMKLEDRREGALTEFVRSYAACVRFADAQIGRLIDALDKSPRKDQTIVILWSDHGFHLGEKNHLEKFALWEKTNHIPLIIVAPGVTQPGTVCEQPVDLTLLYPTLLELFHLPPDPLCDGRSVVPLLRNPMSKWDQPAVMTYGRGNHAVRTRRWRYIRYADGSQELYDHESDPNEWNNLAGLSTSAETMTRLQEWMPTAEAMPVRDLRRAQ